MNFNVEDGSGVLWANSYASLTFAYMYLKTRGRLADWEALGLEAQKVALVEATDYIDRRWGSRFLGRRTHSNLLVPAMNTMMVTAVPAVGSTLTLGTSVYTFVVGAISTSEIEIGQDQEDQAQKIGARLSTNMEITTSVAGILVMFQSNTPGKIDVFPTSSTSPALMFEYPQLEGGSISGVQSLAFPRTAFKGIPTELRMATVEYATRAAQARLMPDPLTDETGLMVKSKTETAGPITESYEYQLGTGKTTITEYPEADLLIRSLLGSTGGVYR